MQNQTKPEPLGASVAKLVLVVVVIVTFGALLGVAGYLTKKSKPIQPPQKLEVNAIEISADKKSILNAETKGVIFTIADTQKYLKDSGYFYNPDTFQDSNAKYEGDCFIDAALSNRKRGMIKNTNNSAESKIVFSTGCLSGDLPQAWAGVYYFGIKELMPDCSVVGKSCIDNKQNPVLTSVFQFLIGGSGRNFVWSADDKTITYKVDLGLSGLTETRTIDATTGDIIKSKNKDETADWKTYRNEEYGFEIKYPPIWSYNDGPLPYTFYFGNKSYPYDAQMGIWVTPTSNLKDFYQDEIPKNCEGIFLAGSAGWKCEGEQYSETERGVKSGYMVKHIYVEVENDNKFYFFSISAAEQDASARFKFFNQILSTFKFIEKDETANWKTYESSKMNFSIKAPPDFEAFLDINPMDTPSKDELISNFFIKDTNDSRDIIFEVSIESWTSFINMDKYPEEYTFKESVDDEIEFFKSRLDPNLKKEDFILDNVLATKVYYEVEHSIAGEKEKRITVYAQKGKRMYSISAFINEKEQIIYIPIFDQILSTFKFIKLN